MSHNELWRHLLGHDGYFVAKLRLLSVDEGGRSRVVQSGFKAGWWLPGSNYTLGPIEIIGEAKCIRPGSEQPVRIFPLHPSAWRSIEARSVVRLARPPLRQGRFKGELLKRDLGIAVIERRVGVPQRGGGSRDWERHILSRRVPGSYAIAFATSPDEE